MKLYIQTFSTPQTRTCSTPQSAASITIRKQTYYTTRRMTNKLPTFPEHQYQVESNVHYIKNQIGGIGLGLDPPPHQQLAMYFKVTLRIRISLPQALHRPTCLQSEQSSTKEGDEPLSSSQDDPPDKSSGSITGPAAASPSLCVPSAAGEGEGITGSGSGDSCEPMSVFECAKTDGEGISTLQS